MSIVSKIREFLSPTPKTEKQSLKVNADISTAAIGSGSSLSPYVNTCRDILQAHNLKLHPHAFGTNIEGDLNDVADALRECHQKLHKEGVPRVSTNITISTRTDKTQSIASRLAT